VLGSLPASGLVLRPRAPAPGVAQLIDESFELPPDEPGWLAGPPPALLPAPERGVVGSAAAAAAPVMRATSTHTVTQQQLGETAQPHAGPQSTITITHAALA